LKTFLVGSLLEHLPVGSTAMSAPADQTALGEGMVARLRGPGGKDVGTAYLESLRDLVEAGGDPDVYRSFLLLGDPAAR
jgi:hypothetical protein